MITASKMHLLRMHVFVYGILLALRFVFSAQSCIPNRPVSQMRAPQEACRELVLDYNTLPKRLYGFEDKT